MKRIVFCFLGLLMFSCASVFSAVQITELPDKGYSITADNYTAACDATGMLTSIKVGGVEFLSPSVQLDPGWIPVPAIIPTVYASEIQYYQFVIPFTGPVTREGDSLKVQNKDWWLRYTFTPESIDLEASGQVWGLGSKSQQVPQPYPFLIYPQGCLTFLLSSGLDRLADPLAQGDLGWSLTSRPEPGNYLVTAKNGAGLVFENASWPEHIVEPRIPNPLHRLDEIVISNRPNEAPEPGPTLKRRILAFPHPDLERSLEMKIISPNPDHLFSHATEVTFPVEVTAHYGQAFKGFLRFEGNNYVWTQDKVSAEVPVNITPEHPTQTVNLVIHPPKPGHIVGKVIATDGTTTFNAKRIGFVYNPEQIPPVVPPKDFDAFWDDTMKQLDQVPLDLTLTEQKDLETAKGKIYLVKYRSWGGQWAWAWLSEPKTTEKIDAIVQCPPVSVFQPEKPLPADGEFCIKVAVHGGDLMDYPAKPANGFDYMNGGLQSRDTAALRYSFCCLARCFDIIKSRPLCNGVVHVRGGSQGGGLSFVLAGLRPVADVSATNIALIRTDWSALGYTHWGPNWGPDPQKTAEILRYYDPACFMHRIHAPMILFVGLFDFTGPVQGVFTGINDLPKGTSCKVVIDPYGGHFTSNFEGRKDASKVVEIPRWQGSAADNKVHQ